MHASTGDRADPLRVILIDDDEFVRFTVAAMLESAGFEVLTATDGNGGLDLHERHGAQVVITDLLMPEKEGIETILELRKRDPDLSIIAISGSGEANTVRFLDIAKKLGADRILPKPFNRERLLETIADCTAGHGRPPTD